MDSGGEAICCTTGGDGVIVAELAVIGYATPTFATGGLVYPGASDGLFMGLVLGGDLDTEESAKTTEAVLTCDKF